MRSTKLKPTPCKHCGGPQHYILEYVIGECRQLGPRPVKPAMLAADGRRVVWTRPGQTISSRVLMTSLRALDSLDTRRHTRERVPGERWKLELIDGVPWAPWCPVGWGSSFRGGDRLPYRESTLRPSRWARRCYTCDAELSAGDTVWRPHNPAGSLSAADWSSEANRNALVCRRCVSRLRMHVVTEDPPTPTPAPLRALDPET